MSFESDFLDMMPRTLLVYPFSSETGGTATYGAARGPYQCAIKDDVKYWKWEDGNEFGPRRSVYVNTGSDPKIGLKDKLVLSTSETDAPTTCFPVYVIHRDDEGEYHHTEIFV